MKFLAIDTSGKHLSVIAYSGGIAEKVYLPECAMKHSVMLMDEVCGALSRAGMSAADCDFFAAVVGPGSFTGIRIGISTVKGLCFACGKPALSVTSFDCIAYDKEYERLLALIDAGRGEFYACGYEGGKPAVAPCILSPVQAEELRKTGYVLRSAEELTLPCGRADPCNGLLNAVLSKAEERKGGDALHALYLRKSSAEEQKK